MKHLFVVNPAAGDENKSILERGIRELGFSDSEIRYTEKKAHAIDLAAQTDGTVYAVGGDGTIREVAEGVVRAGNLMCVLPAGSGNDFVRSLYPKTCSFPKVLSAIPKMRESLIDYGETSHGVFVNIASVGFDAEVVRNSKRFQKIPFLRHISYILSIFYTIMSYRGMSMHVEIDGEVLDRDLLLLAVANGQYYGGGIRIAPDAELDDGLFDVYWIEKVSRLRFLTLLPHILDGSHVRLKQVRHFRARKIVFRSQTEFMLNLDGELLPTDHAEINVKPSALRILRPEKEELS